MLKVAMRARMLSRVGIALVGCRHPHGDTGLMFVLWDPGRAISLPVRDSHHTKSFYSNGTCVPEDEWVCSALRCQGAHKRCSNQLAEEPTSIFHIFSYRSSTKYVQILN